MNDITPTVPGTETELELNLDVTPDDDQVPFGYIRLNGHVIPQTLVCCPACGDPRIETDVEAVSVTFRLNNQHIWTVAPIDQGELKEILNQQDTPVRCMNTDCEWRGRFGELLNLE